MENQMTKDILNALDNNEFKMYFQFIVDSKSKKIVSAEALSRWESPEKGLIGPFQYIGHMEANGLISRHDFHMFELACSQLEKWSETEYKNISVSCNFTRITLSEKDCGERFKAIAEKYDFDRSKLAIEITEDTIERNMEIAKRNVMACKELGFKVYLDDLGSGYTPLSNLCDYPIDIVKIDRDILLKADTEKGKALLSGIIDLVHGLNMFVICEGVETDVQSALVSDMKCDYIQGWYYSKPLALNEIEKFIEDHSVKYMCVNTGM